MNLSEYVAKIETAMVDSKAALEEKGILLERVPVLSDLPALIRAIATGVIPESYGVGTPRSIKEHVSAIEAALTEIGAALNEFGIDTEGLRVSQIPAKIREISYAKGGSKETFWPYEYPAHILFKNVEIPEGVETYDWSQNKDGSVLIWLDEATDTLHISSKDPTRQIIFPQDASEFFGRGEEYPEGSMVTESVEFYDVDFSEVTTMRYMFSMFISLRRVDLHTLDTSNVTDMAGLFSTQLGLKEVNVKGLNTSKVTDMSYMFDSCQQEPLSIDLSGWDTSHVTNMSHMFYDCWTVTDINLSGWDTSSVTDMEAMFSSCHDLTSLDVSHFKTGNVTNMGSMFFGCGFDTIDLTSWDTHSVTNMGHMFNACEKLTSLDVTSFDTSNVTDMSLMFANLNVLETLDLSNFDIHAVTDMYNMFWDSTALKTIYAAEWANDHNPELSSKEMFDNNSSLYYHSGDITYAKWRENGGNFTNPANKVDDTT